MEFFAFLGLAFIVGIVLLARSRAGGSGSRTVGPPKHLEGGPINYGEFVAPRGTSPGASVNAPWFGRDHSGDAGRGGGSGE
jgi:hypothetical protein